MAEGIKENMTLAYETVVTYTALANQLEDNMTHVYSLVSDISAISLPSLEVDSSHTCALPRSLWSVNALIVYYLTNHKVT